MIQRLLSTASLALVALLASGTVGAQQPQQPQQPQLPQQPANGKEAKVKFTEKFNAADTNHDGKLTREEAEAGMPEVYKNFDKIDTKKTGAITQRQIGAYWAAKTKQRSAKQDPGSLN
jgi:Ca2+-binding EF-hand superfamily protein